MVDAGIGIRAFIGSIVVADVSLQQAGGVMTTRNADLSERMQNFKSWGVSTFLKTRQKVKEKLSRASRTVDLGLEDRIGVLR